ncbi:MAG TPA: hypothetical protein PL182_10915 [Pseudobdellovibrionaceae bacterium]|nr:hypothetical protein [Pseudobdellovibrionaceae bacterium]
MKALVLTLALFAGSFAAAHEGGNFGTVVCIQNSNYSPIQDSKILVLMQQIAQSRNYQLSVYQTVFGNQRQLVHSEIVKVTTEDVMANFKGKKASVMIYLDELNQSSLSIEKTKVSLICKPNSRL